MLHLLWLKGGKSEVGEGWVGRDEQTRDLQGERSCRKQKGWRGEDVTDVEITL